MVVFWNFVRWGLVAILAFAGASKLFWPQEIERALLQGAMVPASWAPLVARGLPISELLLAFLLALRRAEAFVLPAILFLSLVFSGLHVYTYSNGILVPCTCVGGASISFASRKADFMMIVVSLAMVAFSSVLLVPYLRGRSPSVNSPAILDESPA